MAKRKYCLKFGEKSSQDHKFSIEEHKIDLPSFVDLRTTMPDLYNQLELGSCSSNAIAAALQYDMLLNKQESFTPSRLFIYYNERMYEGNEAEDAGAVLKDGIRSCVNLGFCKEIDYPYITNKFADRPKDDIYSLALQHKVLSYKAVDQDLVSLKTALANGFPVILGILVYQSFESEQVTKTGYVPMPGPDDRPLGGHAILCVGFVDKEKKFILRNSWGSEWGDKGYFYLDYDYLINENLASDFWVVYKTS